jgi:uncharacterized protein (DUF2267 family)
MPLPQEYWLATRDFERFIEDLKAASMLTTSNQCYTMARSTLHVFRSHVTIKQALAFAALLPPVLRAIFVEDWDPDLPVTPFPNRKTLTDEVKAIRGDHNFSTDDAISEVATALRQHVNLADFERLLAAMTEDARAFWRV